VAVERGVRRIGCLSLDGQLQEDGAYRGYQGTRLIDGVDGVVRHRQRRW
jgi:hypothetical protein